MKVQKKVDKEKKHEKVLEKEVSTLKNDEKDMTKKLESLTSKLSAEQKVHAELDKKVHNEEM